MNMSKDTVKKEIEFSYLTSFEQECSDFPEGKVKKTEKPDFLIYDKHNNFIVGIEMTVFDNNKKTKNGYSVRAHKKLGDDILEAAHKIYFSNEKAIPVTVYIMFKDNLKCKSNQKNKFGRELADLIRCKIKNISFNDITLDIRLSWEDLKSLSFGVKNAHIFYYPKIKLIKSWNPTSSFWLSYISPLDIQKILDKKELRIKEYRKKCDACWLIIVEELNESSAFSEIKYNSFYLTSFDRIFIYRAFNNKIIELGILDKTNI